MYLNLRNKNRKIYYVVLWVFIPLRLQTPSLLAAYHTNL